MPAQVLADYLNDIHRVRCTRAGADEVSYYGALPGALDTIGATLKPRAFAVSNLRNRGAGFPDMGFFAIARGQPLSRDVTRTQGPTPEWREVGAQITKLNLKGTQRYV